MIRKIEEMISETTYKVDRLYDLVTLYDKTETNKMSDAVKCIHLIGKLESLIDLLKTEHNDNSVEKVLNELAKRKAKLVDILEDAHHKERVNKVVVIVHGGMVQDVYSEEPIDVVIEDRDTEEYDPDHKEDTSKMMLAY